MANSVRPPNEAESAQPAPEAGENFDRLKALLREMFQLDRGDLDFGLYRIMNMKAQEITAFLDNDLLPQVKTTLNLTSERERSRLEEKLKNVLDSALRAGFDPDTSPAAQELREQIEEMKRDATAEADVYNHLVNFFSRYYSEGDFVSLRRYSGGGDSAYLIPYDGEEVKLHWANADQYYIKTTENYASYVFTVGKDAAARRVRFEIAAADNERDNIKEANGKQRRFLLAKGRGAVKVEGEDLVVYFEHRPLKDNEKKMWPGNGNGQQGKINAATVERILNSNALDPNWKVLLAAPEPTEANGERRLLDKHVERYTAKNSFDYFIHKDLRKFLRRELDLYLNTEVLNLEDLEQKNVVKLDRALARVRATRHVGGKIIDFLAQLENFQKQLWLKKKFVLESHWCVTLDRVSEDLYPEIAANEEQRKEWVELFAIDEVESDLGNGGAGYTEPLSVEFLKANPFLVVDTRHFDRDFSDRLLEKISEAGSLDDQMNGLLVHGENFQALNFLQMRYVGGIKCVYTDPPFNTKDGDFAYKDNYRSSSWLSAMLDRMALARSLMSQDGQFAIHIDENENENLHRLMNQIFGTDNYLGEMIWNKRNPKGDAKGLAVQHESILWAIRDIQSLSSIENGFRRPKKNAPKMIDMAKKFVKTSSDLGEASKKFEDWLKTQRFSAGELAYKSLDGKGRIFQEVSMAWPNRNKAPKEYCEPLIHPVTGKACPVPRRGWRNTPSKMRELLENDLIVFGPDETTQPRRKYILTENMYENIPSVYDFGASADFEAEALGLSFETMKPLELVKYIILTSDHSETIIDYFAGSGTAGHATISLNRENGGNRKYILIEMADYFDAVLLPRIKKVVYSADWKDGKPVSREGCSQVFKYIRLESYEDTLDGLELTPPPGDLLAQNAELAEDYRLRYALGAETTGSACLLGKSFADPFSYTLSVVRDGVRREVSVDLPETFNYLIGLRMESRRRIDGVLAITGMDARGDKCLILWRNMAETDNNSLDSWLEKNREWFPKSLDLIYVNGDHTLNAVKQEKETWAAETIEPVFRELMFEGASDG